MVTISTGTSWVTFLRVALSALAVFMLAPVAVLPLGLLAFLLLPAAVFALPFLMVSFLGSANTEHQEAVKRASWRPMPHAMPARA